MTNDLQSRTCAMREIRPSHCRPLDIVGYKAMSRNYAKYHMLPRSGGPDRRRPPVKFEGNACSRFSNLYRSVGLTET
jgi:hypothetical protein